MSAQDLAPLFEPGGKLENLGPLEHGWLLLDRAVRRLHQESKHEQADEMAEQLLLEARLPMVLRARALIALSTRNDGFSIERAEHAVRIMEVDVKELCEETQTEYPQNMHRMAVHALEMAKELDQHTKDREARKREKKRLKKEAAALAKEMDAADLMDDGSKVPTTVDNTAEGAPGALSKVMDTATSAAQQDGSTMIIDSPEEDGDQATVREQAAHIAQVTGATLGGVHDQGGAGCADVGMEDETGAGEVHDSSAMADAGASTANTDAADTEARTMSASFFLDKPRHLEDTHEGSSSSDEQSQVSSGSDDIPEVPASTSGSTALSLPVNTGGLITPAPSRQPSSLEEMVREASSPGQKGPWLPLTPSTGGGRRRDRTQQRAMEAVKEDSDEEL